MLIQVIETPNYQVWRFLALEIQEAVAKKEKFPRFGGMLHL